jgi:Ferric reductase like transmembrane component/Ferric reductase NAD binding domain
MGWPYQFVSLSPEQISERRRLLDLYGFYAWISPIIVVSAMYYGRRLLFDFSSSTSRSSATKPPTFLELNARRLSWILNTPLPSDFGTLKVHLTGVLYASWLLFLATHQTGTDYMHFTKRLGHIAVSQLPLQYLLSIKSPLSPIQLATKLTHETLNPYHRLTGRIVHVFLLAHAILYLNFFYWISALPRRLYARDVQLGLLSITLLTALAITARPTIRKKAYHKKFYVPHAVLSFLLIPAISAHVPYTRRYILQILIIYLFNVATRKANTTTPTTAANITAVPDTGNALLRISLPTPPPPFGSPIPTWIPGQHIYLKSGQNPIFPRSPFTIVSTPPVLPNAPENAKMYQGYPIPPTECVVRNLGGPTTGWLADSIPKPIIDAGTSPVRYINGIAIPPSKPPSPSASATQKKAEILMEGPYGSSSSFIPSLLASMSNVDSGEEEVLLVAGGVGATHTIPIYLSLLSAATAAEARRSAGKDQEQNQRQDRNKVFASISKRIHFHWIVRSREEAQWGIEYLRSATVAKTRTEAKKHDRESSVAGAPAPASLSGGMGANVTVHITSKPDTNHEKAPTAPQPSIAPASPENHNNTNEEAPTPIPIEIQILNPGTRPNLTHLISSVFSPAPTTPTPRNSPPHNANPDHNTPISGHANKHHGITVLVCAPPGLTKALRHEVGSHVWRHGRDVVWHEEAFGMGV